MKECTKCKQTKPLVDFHADNSQRDGHRKWCRSCANGAAKSNLVLARKHSAKWRANNAETNRAHQRKFKYGITPDQYSQLLTEQNNCCAICHNVFVGIGHTSTAPCVDHCHTSGAIRGVLCGSCNKMLGSARDSVSTLLSAVDYLTKQHDSASIS